MIDFIKDGKNQATYSAISASSSGSGDWYWIGLQEDTIGAWVSFLSPYDSYHMSHMMSYESYESYDMKLYGSNHMILS